MSGCCSSYRLSNDMKINENGVDSPINLSPKFDGGGKSFKGLRKTF